MKQRDLASIVAAPFWAILWVLTAGRYGVPLWEARQRLEVEVTAWPRLCDSLPMPPTKPPLRDPPVGAMNRFEIFERDVPRPPTPPPNMLETATGRSRESSCCPNCERPRNRCGCEKHWIEVF